MKDVFSCCTNIPDIAIFFTETDVEGNAELVLGGNWSSRGHLVAIVMFVCYGLLSVGDLQHTLRTAAKNT